MQGIYKIILVTIFYYKFPLRLANKTITRGPAAKTKSNAAN